MSGTVPLVPPAARIDEALAIVACRRAATPAMRGWCFHALLKLRARYGSLAAAHAAATAAARARASVREAAA